MSREDLLKDNIWMDRKIDPVRAVGHMDIALYCRTTDVFELAISQI
ncbi:MAG: hypothetical protein HY670_01950 [Chloroflexi bacterium]|nr:hypothetical protein [Chloroflexota bacterium]